MSNTRIWPGQPYPLGASWDGKGVNFAYADGHVGFLSSSLDWRVFRALATRAGGEPVGEGY